MVPLVLQCVIVFDVPVESGFGPEHEFKFPEFVGHGDSVGAGAVSSVGHVHPLCVPHIVEFNPQAKSVPCMRVKCQVNLEEIFVNFNSIFFLFADVVLKKLHLLKGIF